MSGIIYIPPSGGGGGLNSLTTNLPLTDNGSLTDPVISINPLSSGTSNEIQYTDNAGGFLASILKQSGGVLGVGGTDTQAILSLNSTTQGFLMPRLFSAATIVGAAAGMQVYEILTQIPKYAHVSDGWIPVGRYAGNPYTVAGAKDAQMMGSNLDGELIPMRLIGAGSTIYPGTGGGNYSHNSTNLGSSGQNFLYGYFNRTYVNQIYIGGAGLGVITATSTTGAGMRFSVFSAGVTNNFMKLHGETAYKGLSVRDTDIASIDRIEASAVMEIQSTTRGFLPPKMTGTQVEAISTPAEGLMTYATTSGSGDVTNKGWWGYDGSNFQSFTATGSGGASFPFSGSAVITGSLLVSGSTENILTVEGSGSNLFTVNGTLGQMFVVNDSFTGSLFGVSDISGLAPFEVFSDNTILMGDPAILSLNTTTKQLLNTGNTVIYDNIPTSSYSSAFFEYTVVSASNARSGKITTVWIPGTANITSSEVTSPDIGSTTGFALTAIFTGSNVALTGSATTDGWLLSSIIRGI